MGEEGEAGPHRVGEAVAVSREPAGIMRGVKELPREEKGLGRTGYGRQWSAAELSKDGFEKDSRVQEFLTKVDFETARGIYAELYARNGGTAADMNFIGPDRFYVRTKDGTTASFLPDENIITINKTKEGELKLFSGAHTFYEKYPDSQYFAAPDLDDATFGKIDAIFNVFHEEAHAVSSNTAERISGFFASFFEGEKYDVTMGYGTLKTEHQIFSGELKTRLLGEIVNEGVTQLMALNVLSEYYRRKGTDDMGISSGDAQKYISCFNNDLFKIGFRRKPEVEFVRIFAEYLASIAEVPREIVWQGIVRGYLRGGNLFDERIATAFKEHGSEKIFDLLKSFDTSLSDESFADFNVALSLSRRGDAIRTANATLFETLPQDSKEYLAEIFSDDTGIRVKKAGSDWIPFAEMQRRIKEEEAQTQEGSPQTA